VPAVGEGWGGHRQKNLNLETLAQSDERGQVTRLLTPSEADQVSCIYILGWVHRDRTGSEQ
jgi:hypothetical protein